MNNKKNNDTHREVVIEKQYNDAGIRSFADWTNNELFQTIPAMVVKKAKIGEATDYGDGTYIIDVNGTTLSDYQEYLSLVEESGFKKYVDNQIAESLYSTIYTKGDLVVTITQVVNLEKTYIGASDKMQLSEHLLYDSENVSKSVDGAKTKLHMMELYDNGSSFIIQLKNGHFLVNDGGNSQDAPYLFDYLESLVKDGEKPIVEAWIFLMDMRIISVHSTKF